MDLIFENRYTGEFYPVDITEKRTCKKNYESLHRVTE